MVRFEDVDHEVPLGLVGLVVGRHGWTANTQKCSTEQLRFCHHGTARTALRVEVLGKNASYLASAGCSEAQAQQLKTGGSAIVHVGDRMWCVMNDGRLTMPLAVVAPPSVVATSTSRDAIWLLDDQEEEAMVRRLAAAVPSSTVAMIKDVISRGSAAGEEGRYVHGEWLETEQFEEMKSQLEKASHAKRVRPFSLSPQWKHYDQACDDLVTLRKRYYAEAAPRLLSSACSPPPAPP